MTNDITALVAAIRAHPWAIQPAYLEAIEAVAARAFESGALRPVANDGHQARLQDSLSAVAAVGTPLEGARMSTVRDGVAVVPVFGPIFPRANMINSSAGGTSLDAIMRDMRVALADGNVERIVMLFDTPGGVVSGLGEAAEAIRGASKPISGFVTGIAASAGYWLASQTAELVVERAASVGSIGVVASTSRQEGPGADGRRSYEIVSSGAPRKRPDPSTDEGRAAIQEEVDAIEAVFVGDVAKGRKTTAANVLASFGRGAMVPAGAAIDAGMADRIGTLEGVLRNPGRTRVNTGGRRALAAAEVETRRRAADWS
ncbi:S49 family peptidase [Cereibacter azotoformans]|uniref:S49 family peptidase n=1 Tax=Cereibacter azotoformans TaxID=43057 RepID=UPI000E35B429|nr:S49 family peptidase [Cereibacter azotoformans]AXQ93197.1 S49 family peptidase [Cereibacter sphaeroides]UIJ31508.1 S49 family peptidase [Cereibacter azotoformans]